MHMLLKAVSDRWSVVAHAFNPNAQAEVGKSLGV